MPDANDNYEARGKSGTFIEDRSKNNNENFKKRMKNLKEQESTILFGDLLKELKDIHKQNYENYSLLVKNYCFTEPGIRSTQIMALLDLLVNKGILR